MKASPLLSVMVSLLVLSCSSGTDVNRELRYAQELLANGEYDQAFDEFMRAAEEKDNPLAKNTIAMFYDLGWGRPTDPVKACQWYEQAAQDDIPVAADALGRCLEQGIHRKPDPAQAAVWYQKAADLGLHYALCHLGDLYISGLGVDGDPARGLALCQKSAEQGSVPAMLRLADYYQTEDGISNDESALHWLSAAAGYQSAEAEFQLGVMLRDGRGIDRDPIVARSWFEQAASRGYVPAYFETANLYFHAPANPETGLWHENDLAKAYMWLSATLQKAEDVEQREHASEMMEKVREVMPETWTADLDAKVEAHLEQFAATDAP